MLCIAVFLFGIWRLYCVLVSCLHSGLESVFGLLLVRLEFYAALLFIFYARLLGLFLQKNLFLDSVDCHGYEIVSFVPCYFLFYR